MLYPANNTDVVVSWRYVTTSQVEIGTTGEFNQFISGCEGLAVTYEIFSPSGASIATGTADETDEGNGLYEATVPLALITDNGYYRCVATTSDTTPDAPILTEFFYIDKSIPLPTTVSAVQLSTLIAMAQRRTDHLVTASSGKWSTSWWTALINQVKNVVAHETGFYHKRFMVQAKQYAQTSALPTTLATGARSIWLGDDYIRLVTELEMMQYDTDWRYQTELPNQPGGGTVSAVSSAAGDTTQTLTITGITTDGTYTTGTIALNGTTAVVNSTTTWDEIFTATLDAATTGTVTLANVTTGLAITTIAPTVLTAGSAPPTGRPTHAVIRAPYIEWYPIPDQDYTMALRGCAIPGDLSNGTDGITGLPAQFAWVIVDGAAALAELGDLYTNSQSAKQNLTLVSFWSGVKQLKHYVDSLSGETGGVLGRGWGSRRTIPVSSSVTLPITG